MRPLGSGIHIQLEGDGAWEDLKDKHVEQAKEIHIAALPNATSEGRAAVMIRLDRKNGGVIVHQVTLREFSAAHRAIVARYGEDFMRPNQSDSANIEMLQFTIQELSEQLIRAKVKLGEPAVIDMTQADKKYQERKRAKQ